MEITKNLKLRPERMLRRCWSGLGLALSLVVVLLSACSSGTAMLRSAETGLLAPCASGPHCVSSEATDPARKVAPLHYTGPRTRAEQKLIKVVRAMPGAAIVTEQPDYIHATYTSNIMKFVDDVEFVLPADRDEIQVRSSSRIGYYDFGVNRARVASIRRAFDAVMATN